MNTNEITYEELCPGCKAKQNEKNERLAKENQEAIQKNIEALDLINNKKMHPLASAMINIFPSNNK